MQEVAVPMKLQLIEAQDQLGTQQGYDGSKSKWLGVTQIAIGIICILIQSISIGVQAGFFFMASGIWCGAFFIVTGSFGIVAANTKRTGFIITFMILSIFAAGGFVVCLLAFSALGLVLQINNCEEYSFTQHRCITGRVTEGILVATAMFELIIAIISSVIGCQTICCSRPATGGQLYHIHATNGQEVSTTAPPTEQPQHPGMPAQPQQIVGNTLNPATSQPQTVNTD